MPSANDWGADLSLRAEHRPRKDAGDRARGSVRGLGGRPHDYMKQSGGANRVPQAAVPTANEII